MTTTAIVSHCSAWRAFRRHVDYKRLGMTRRPERILHLIELNVLRRAQALRDRFFCPFTRIEFENTRAPWSRRRRGQGANGPRREQSRGLRRAAFARVATGREESERLFEGGREMRLVEQDKRILPEQAGMNRGPCSSETP